LMQTWYFKSSFIVFILSQSCDSFLSQVLDKPWSYNLGVRSLFYAYIHNPEKTDASSQKNKNVKL